MAEENVPDIDPIQGLEALPRLRYLVIKYGNIPLSPQDRKKLLSQLEETCKCSACWETTGSRGWKTVAATYKHGRRDTSGG